MHLQEDDRTLSENWGVDVLSLFFEAAPEAHGSSQARGLIGATGAGRSHSHSNVGSELRLPPTPRLTATLHPLTHRARPGIELVGSVSAEPQWGLTL